MCCTGRREKFRGRIFLSCRSFWWASFPETSLSCWCLIWVHSSVYPDDGCFKSRLHASHFQEFRDRAEWWENMRARCFRVGSEEVDMVTDLLLNVLITGHGWFFGVHRHPYLIMEVKWRRRWNLHYICNVLNLLYPIRCWTGIGYLTNYPVNVLQLLHNSMECSM